MLSQVFQKHQQPNFMPVAQLEAEMRAQMATMQQAVTQLQAPVAPAMSMQQAFSSVSQDVRNANRTISFAETAFAEMSGIGLDDAGSASFFSLMVDICDSFSPEAADVLENIEIRGNLHAAIDVAVELRDQATSNPRVQSMAKAAFDKDMERFAAQQQVKLGSSESLSGLQNRLELMQKRFEQVQEAKTRGLDYVELNENGINLPEMQNDKLGWKDVQPAFRRNNGLQAMRLSA